MNRAQPLATSILALTALLGASAAQAASPTQQTGQVVDQSTQAAPAQAAGTQTGPGLVAESDSNDRDAGGVEGDDRDEYNDADNDDRDEHNDAQDNDREDHNSAEDDVRDQHHDADDDDREDRDQTGDNEGEHDD